ncbi:MAG: Gfo/Idh/MocA family oxidoreductase [Acidimicrobiales bacterium]|jgi:predicted dehydrogenase
MTSLDRIRLGVLGAGNVADLNVAGYLEDPRCEVIAVCDVLPDAAESAGKRWGVPKIYTDMDRFLADDDIDAVEIVTPTYLHHSHVLDALAAGKHISVQKPLSNTIDEADEMGDAAAGAGLTLRVGECMVHYPPLELAKRLISDGAIGKPVGLRIRTVVGQTDSAFQAGLNADGYSWRLDARSPGGHLFDDMVHKYAVALWLLDQDVTSVQAVVRRRDLYFEPCVALFEFEDPDLLGTMEVVYAPQMWLRSQYFGADEFFEIQGEEGSLWVTRATGEMLDLAPVVLYQGKDNKISTTRFTEVDSNFATGFKRSSSHFIDALISGDAASMTPVDARKVLQLCFAVYLAGETRQAVDPRVLTGSVSPSGWADW